MRSKTKTRLLLTAFTLLILGWSFPEWRPGFVSALPYYEHLATDLRRLHDELQGQFDSARTSSYGVFVRDNIAAIGGIYGLFALLLLLEPRYRNERWNVLRYFCIVFVIFVVWFVVVDWIVIACRELNHAQGGTLEMYRRGIGSWLISIATGLIWPLLTIALMLTLWIAVPLYLLWFLFCLPSIVYVVLRLIVRLPFLAYHSLHYLIVPHPGETAYRAGMPNNLPIPELARTVADAMYRYELKDFDALPKAWKSKNWTKRIDAFHDRLKAEDRFMEELIKNLRLKSHFRE